MTARDRLAMAAFGFEAIVLAVVEVFFLPLRFDGTLLPDLGGWPFPITALLAALTMPWLVSRCAELSGWVILVGLPLWLWLAVIAFLGVAGTSPEGMVLLEDWRLLVLLAAGAFPAAVALGNAAAKHQRAGRAGKPR